MNCSNCKTADQTGEFCSFCGAKMADQVRSEHQKAQEVEAGSESGLTSIEDAATLFETGSKTTNVKAAEPEVAAAVTAASFTPSPDDGVDVAMEVFGEIVEKMNQQPTVEEQPEPVKPETSAEQKKTADAPQSAAPSSTSVIAIAAFVSVFFIPLLGLILGYLAKKDIAQSPGNKSGKGLAKASIVLGWIFVSFGALFTLLVIAAALSKQ